MTNLLNKGVRYDIQIEIDNFEVDEKYFTFDYRVYVDGEIKDEGQINDDYENGYLPEGQKELLMDGEALNLVFERGIDLE